jgi:5'-3' exonuclease
MSDPVTQKFVENMLKSAKEQKREIKPQSSFDGVNPNDIARITNNLREKIQKGIK